MKHHKVALSADDFKELIEGRVVVLDGYEAKIHIILSDIGFATMLEMISTAVMKSADLTAEGKSDGGEGSI